MSSPFPSTLHPESCCPPFVLAIQTLVRTRNIGWKSKKKLLLLLEFQSKECLTDRARNALPIEITTRAPGALISLPAGFGKQHLMCLQIKWLTPKTEQSLNRIKVGCRIYYEANTKIEWWFGGRRIREMTNTIWPQGGREVPSGSPVTQADMSSSSLTLTPSFTYLLLSLLSLFCALPQLWHLSSSLLFSSCIVLCPVLFCSDLFFLSCTVLCLILLFTVLLYCYQLDKGNMWWYCQLILCARLCLRHFLSRESFRNKNTEQKVQADEYSTRKKRQPGRQKNLDFNRQPNTSVFPSIQPQSRGSACTVPQQM